MYMVVSKWGKITSELQIGDVEIKQLQNCKTKDGLCSREIQRCFGVVKEAFPKVNKV